MRSLTHSELFFKRIFVFQALLVLCITVLLSRVWTICFPWMTWIIFSSLFLYRKIIFSQWEEIVEWTWAFILRVWTPRFPWMTWIFFFKSFSLLIFSKLRCRISKILKILNENKNQARKRPYFFLFFTSKITPLHHGSLNKDSKMKKRENITTM